jgi:hypothetical protein
MYCNFLIWIIWTPDRTSPEGGTYMCNGLIDIKAVEITSHCIQTERWLDQNWHMRRWRHQMTARIHLYTAGTLRWWNSHARPFVFTPISRIFWPKRQFHDRRQDLASKSQSDHIRTTPATEGCLLEWDGSKAEKRSQETKRNGED